MGKLFGSGFILLLSCFQPSLLYVVPTYKNVSFHNEKINFVNLDPPCFSQIYCHGKLLETVQMANIYPDSKTFVDMKLKLTPDETIRKFDDMMKTHGDQPDSDVVKDFVDNHFAKPGEELIKWTPTDWKEKPAFLDRISDPDLRQWGSDINEIWFELGRKMIHDVEQNPDQYSIIHVEHPVIIPGGRFREFYYWDSYWIIRGLLYSEMFTTARGMLLNFLSIVDRYGFIPNGGRIYYSKRSQPPLLAAMIDSYVKATNDVKFAIQSVKTLEHEFQFWMNNHTYEVKGHHLAMYGDKSSGPRPESYREDIKTTEDFDTNEAKQEHYAELKAAAESGMDFSSRWFISADGTNNGTLKNLKTRSIIPVELNAILYWNAKIISDFYNMAGDTAKAKEYEKKAQEIYEAVQAILWHEDVGAWLDYDIINDKRRDYFTPTNLSPLWMKCFDTNKSEEISKHILRYIDNIEIDKYPGGVPNTLQHTGEQWDYPNVWPPMQYILIVGLDNLGTPAAKALANKWATRWVQSNFQAYKETQAMYEKYDAEKFGGHGGGGEYDVQKGFGWTNGVIIELLAIYGRSLTPAPSTAVTGRACGKLNPLPICLIYTATLLSMNVDRLLNVLNYIQNIHRFIKSATAKRDYNLRSSHSVLNFFNSLPMMSFKRGLSNNMNSNPTSYLY